MSIREQERFDSQQVANMLAVNPVTVRRWRTKNKKVGFIKFGPPYEYHGANVLYPVDKFRAWCSQVKIVDGVPHINLPISANIPLPQMPVMETGNAA